MRVSPSRRTRSCQYQHLFELDGMDLSSPTRHSWRSPRVPTSARRVPAACLDHHGTDCPDLMFDLPSRDDVARVVITRDLVEGVGPAELYRSVRR